MAVGLTICTFSIFGWSALLLIRRMWPLIQELRLALRTTDQPQRSESLPVAEIFLCLKGVDPFLNRCLEGLANQDYPHYTINIVLDSRSDEAAPHARLVQQQYGADRINIIYRQILHPTCSQRASSLMTGLADLQPDTEMAVLCDGDTTPHESWLRELAQGLSDGASATSGNRWYAPEKATLGNLVRYFWNALAVPQMSTQGILWAGSMAMSRKFIDDPGFRPALERTFSEDTCFSGFLIDRGEHPRPLTTLPVINQEDISLRSFWGFLDRQILAARIHHPRWKKICSEAVLLGFAMWVLLPLHAMMGVDSLLMWSGALLLYGIPAHLVIGWYEWLVRRFVRETRTEQLPPYTLARAIMSVPALTILGFIYPVAVIAAACARSHTWRDVVYRVTETGVERVDSRSPSESETSRAAVTN